MAKKPKKSKIPKTIAGVEIPRGLREEGAKLAEMVRHPLVADLVATGLVVLAAKLKSGDSSGTATATPRKAGGTQRDPADAIGQGISALTTMFATKAASALQENAAKPTAKARPAVAKAKPAAAKKAPATSKPKPVRKPSS